MNLKLRGFPESMEFNKDLHHNILNWITPLLHLEGNVSPTVTSAHRVGPALSICPNFPRDVIIHFLYAKERDAVLQLVRKSIPLVYSGSKILVLLDLSQEILLKRKNLKPITDQLKARGIRFGWNATSDIVVLKDGAQYKAEDIASGHTLLAALDISLPPE